MTWEEIGYADGMKQAIGSLSTRYYPTRDKCSEQDEIDYHRGRANALRDHELQQQMQAQGFEHG